MGNVTGKKAGILERAVRFVKEAAVELRKTSWPNASELKKSTALVLVAVAIVTLYIGGLDFFLGALFRQITGW